MSIQIPSFSWLPSAGKLDGFVHLAIHFNDGKPDDIALLKRYNPIPMQPGEREEDVDKCIFTGNLLYEHNVVVTLTGGCPFELSFDVSFKT